MRVLAVLMLAAFVALAGGHHAAAARFGCGKAATVRDKLLCSDPELSAADMKLVASYRAALAPLSDGTREVFRQSQRQWLRFIDAQCGTGGKEPPVPANANDTPKACLLARYAVRQRQLDHATVNEGGLVIARVESFAAQPSNDFIGVATSDIAYPQIDQPRNAAETRWNAAMKQRALAAPSKLAGVKQSDHMVDYRIALVAPPLIATAFTVYDYGHGAAHGGEAVHPSNWLLGAGRDLTAADLFDKTKPWQATLAKLVFGQLQQQDWKDQLSIKSADDIAKIVANSGRWVIERDGLGIVFKEYEIGPHSLGHPEIIVKWSDVQPLLKPALPFALPAASGAG